MRTNASPPRHTGGRGRGGARASDAEAFTGRVDTPGGVAGGHVAGLGHLRLDEAPGRLGSVGIPAEIVGAQEAQVKVPRPRRSPLQGVDPRVVPREARAPRERDGGGAGVRRAITIVTAWREGGGVSGRAGERWRKGDGRYRRQILGMWLCTQPRTTAVSRNWHGERGDVIRATTTC